MSVAGEALDRVDRWLRAHDYEGWDPYDGLSSPLAPRFGGRPRQAFVQLVKRASPLQRRLLLVRPHRMTKTLALAVRGLQRSPQLPDASARAEAFRAEIRGRRTGEAWGYEFDVQTRWAFYPARSPNAIVTAFAVEAVHDLLDADERDEVAGWLVGSMWADSYFRYVPASDVCIHNANVLAARALHRLAPAHPYVERAVRTTLDAIPAGGLWPYGEAANLRWVDNFHTAYVLDALLDLGDALPEAREAVIEAVPRYLAEMFAPDGSPHYYARGGGPADVHNTATSLALLARLARVGLVPGATVEAALRALLALERAPGEYAVGRRLPAYPRWNQAHAFAALAEAAQ